MSKHRRAAKVDANQNEIVATLTKQYGLSVSLNHDDILIGYRGRTYWFEIKDPETAFNKNGTFKKGAIKPSQEKLKAEWKGHYEIVWTVQMILESIGVQKRLAEID